MNIIENIRIAVFSIRTNLTRSLLTMLGIIIGVASVIAIVTVGNGGRDYIVGMIEALGSNMVSITVATDAATVNDYITDEDIIAIKNLDSIDTVSPMAFNMASCESDRENGTAMIMAGTTDLRYIMNTQMMYGRFYNDDDFKAARNVVCIDNLSAFTLFGRENCVGEKISITYNGKTVSFKIIGVGDSTSMMNMDVESMSQMMENTSMMGTMVTMMMPSTTYNEFYGQSGKYQMVYLTANDDRFLDSAGASAANVLKVRHSNSDRDIYKVTNMATYIELIDTVINVFTAFIAAVGAISLVVGGIGVMNIMLVSVTERTREIGIRKALGAKTSTIMLQFLTESVILCSIGGFIGLVIGVAGALAVAAYVNVPIAIKFSTILLAVGFSSAIGIFFGIYPARRAAKMLPIDALRRD